VSTRKKKVDIVQTARTAEYRLGAGRCEGIRVNSGGCAPGTQGKTKGSIVGALGRAFPCPQPVPALPEPGGQQESLHCPEVGGLCFTPDYSQTMSLRQGKCALSIYRQDTPSRICFMEMAGRKPVSWRWWLTPVILAAQEAEIRKISV
jgi:hypothetical protein